MTRSRASIFGDTAKLDLTAFTPKPKADTQAPAADAVRAVTETANFRSREAAAPSAVASASTKRPIRRFRTGRNVQFNVKVLPETVDAIYSISEARGWVLGYTLERAIAALQRELENAT